MVVVVLKVCVENASASLYGTTLLHLCPLTLLSTAPSLTSPLTSLPPYPHSSLSFGQASAMLRRWFAETKGTVNVSTVTVTSHDGLAICLLPVFVVVCCLQAYLWHNNEAVVDWLKGELAEDDPSKSVIAQNVELIRRASVLREVKR